MKYLITHFLAPRLIAHAERNPRNFTVGDDQLIRWWLIPRNRFFNAYLHQVTKSDDDRAA